MMYTYPRAHKTLEAMTDSLRDAARGIESYEGKRKRGAWEVELVTGNERAEISYYHYNTLILRVGGKFRDKWSFYWDDEYYVYGTSASDRDAINAMLYECGIHHKYSYKPVNGGFMRVI